MSIRSDRAKFLTIKCAQELPENELAIVSAKKEYTSAEGGVTETNIKAAVRGLILVPPPSLRRTS